MLEPSLQKVPANEIEELLRLLPKLIGPSSQEGGSMF
jgi:hypothetical protein